MTRAKKNDATRIVGSVGAFENVSPATSFFKTGFSLVIQALAEREETGMDELIVALANPQTGETALSKLTLGKASLQPVIVGRHDRADLGILSDAALSLRHAMVLAHQGENGVPITRILDLRSALKMRDQSNTKHLSIAANGPVALRLADTAFFTLPGHFVDANLLDVPTIAFDLIPWPTPEAWIPESRLEKHLQDISKYRENTSAISVVTQRSHVEDIPRDATLTSSAGVIQLQFNDKVFSHSVDPVSLRGGVLVGRYDRCDLCESKIPMPQVISRVHALFLSIDEQVHIFDTGSTNGLAFRALPIRHLALPDRHPSTFEVMEDVRMTWIPSAAAKEKHH